MAALLRTFVGAFQRAPRLSRQAAAPIGFWSESPGGMPTDEEQATGAERRFMEIEKKGDPYNIIPRKKYAGTKEDPNLIPSIEDKRLVGCLCEPEAAYANWFWLFEGKMHRCWSCGSHYKLVPYKGPV